MHFSFALFLYGGFLPTKKANHPKQGTIDSWCHPNSGPVGPLFAPLRGGRPAHSPGRPGFLCALGGCPSRGGFRGALPAWDAPLCPVRPRYCFRVMALGSAAPPAAVSGWSCGDESSPASPNRPAGGRESASPPWPGSWPPGRCASRTGAGSASPAGPPRGRCRWGRRR